MLLTVDAGNTQTVVGLYELDGESASGRRPEDGLLEPLAHLHRRRAHLRRGRRAAPGLPRPAPAPVQRHRGHRRVLGRPEDHRGAARPRRPVPRLRADRHRAGGPHRHPHRLRQPEGGRRRPHRQRHRRLRPLRRADDRRRLRHGHHLRRGVGERRVPRWRHRPGGRDLHGRPRGQGRRPAGRRAAGAPQRAGQVHGRVDPVGGRLRLRRPGRRPLRPHRRRAGGVHGRLHRRPGRPHHARSPAASSTPSRGSRSTACGWCTRRTCRGLVVRIAVTGMGGELGTRVALLLEARDDVSAIMGVDLEPPRRHLRRAEYHRVDPRDRERTVVDHRRLRPDRARAPRRVRAPRPLGPDQRHDPHRGRAPSPPSTPASTPAPSRRWSSARASRSTAAAPAPRCGPTSPWPPTPRRPFGESLLHAERVAVDGGAKAGVPVSLLRCAPVVGPHFPSPLGRVLRLPGGAGAVVRLRPVLRAAPGGRRRRHRGGRDPAPRRPRQRRRPRCGVGHRGRAPRWRGAHADVGPGLAGGRGGHRDRGRAARRPRDRAAHPGPTGRRRPGAGAAGLQPRCTPPPRSSAACTPGRRCSPARRPAPPPDPERRRPRTGGQRAERAIHDQFGSGLRRRTRTIGGAGPPAGPQWGRAPRDRARRHAHRLRHLRSLRR